jgi:NTE family protein
MTQTDHCFPTAMCRTSKAVSILHLPWARRQDHPSVDAPRTVFVLGGGGNLGAIQVGMLQAVMERGILPDAVVGCSVGALNAAGVAANPTVTGLDLVRDVWMSIREDVICPQGRFTPIRLLTHRGHSLQPNDGLRRVIETHVGYQTFEEFPIPFQVVATSLHTGHDRWFSSGPVVDPILASAALPAVFPPVEIDGELLIDGGVVDNVPISRALLLGATRIVVFHVGNFERPRPVPKRPLDVLVQSFSIARNHRFLREANEVPDGVEMIILPGVDPGKLRYDDFRHSRRLMSSGYAHTAQYLDGLDLAVSALSS